MYVKRLVEDERRLSPWGDERIFLATRPHWFFMVRRGLPGLALLPFGLATTMFREQIIHLFALDTPELHAPSIPPQLRPEAILIWGAVISILAGTIILLWAFLERHFTEYAITTALNASRIVIVSGILSRQTITVPLNMVNDLVLSEPLLGRMLGWGNLEIETGNDYQGDRLDFVPNPRYFQHAVDYILRSGYSGPRRMLSSSLLD